MEHLLPYFLNFEEEIARSKDVKHAKAWWAKLAWEMQSCAEAAELFPDMSICPVCMNGIENGEIFHKHPTSVLN